MDAAQGACCNECVQDMWSFIAIIVFAPLGTFLIIMVALIMFVGKKNVSRGIVGY